MPYFKIDNKNTLVLTNYKVMFTSFKKTKNFTKLKRYKAFILNMMNKPDVLFVVRDPYKRAASFYRDKFQKIPTNAVFDKHFKWEKPQRVFFDKLGISTATHSHEEIKKALLAVTFKDFVLMLKDVYPRDEHIQPQHWIFDHPLYKWYKKFNIQPGRLHIYKMDDAEEMAMFEKVSGFDAGRKENSTSSVKKPFEMDAESIAILNDIYRQDFELYHYAMKS